MSSSYHPHAFFALVVMSSSICSLLIIFWLICSFFFHPPPSFLHITCVCAFVLWNWKIPVGQIIVAPFSSQPLSLSLSLYLSFSLSLWKAPTQLEPRRLKRGAWERRNKGPSVCSHHHSAPPLLSLSLSPPFFPPLVPSPLFPLPTGQRPKLRLQTRKWAH